MIWRIRQRRLIDQTRREGIRVKHGSLSMIFLSTDTDNPQLAFALGRKFGNAVKRNRGRRRLLEAFRSAFDEQSSSYLCGAYLITARPDIVDIKFAEIVEQFDRCFEKLAGQSKV